MIVKRWNIEERCGWMENAADHMEVDYYEGSYVHAADYDALARELTSYQIAKDNLELRLARAVLANAKPIVGTFAGHWTY